MLTGATGFVGTQILQLLTEALPSDSKIIALVRAPTLSQGRRRLPDSLDNANIKLSAENLALLEVCLGYLSKPNLDLGTKQWNRL